MPSKGAQRAERAAERERKKRKDHATRKKELTYPLGGSGNPTRKDLPKRKKESVSKRSGPFKAY